MNVMNLQHLMFAANAHLTTVPDQMISCLQLQSTLDCPSQSPVQESNKGYQCTSDLMLPQDFEPAAYSVICGRGRKSTEAIGNRRLAVIASLFAKRYSDAKKKEDKTLIVSEILEIMRSASPDPDHAFVRHAHGRWFRVEILHAREKIGTVLRDNLHGQYRSSTKSKLAKRKQQKETRRQAKDDTSKPTAESSFLPVSAFSLENEDTGDYLDSIFA